MAALPFRGLAGLFPVDIIYIYTSSYIHTYLSYLRMTQVDTHIELLYMTVDAIGSPEEL